jgi:hypothetical protein
MVKILCYGHGYISSNLMRVIVITFFCCPYSSKVEQNTVNICIDVQVILRAYFEIKFNILFLLAQW